MNGTKKLNFYSRILLHNTQYFTSQQGLKHQHPCQGGEGMEGEGRGEGGFLH